MLTKGDRITTLLPKKKEKEKSRQILETIYADQHFDQTNACGMMLDTSDRSQQFHLSYLGERKKYLYPCFIEADSRISSGTIIKE